MLIQNIQQSKSDPKGKAIASLILGIISFTPIVTQLMMPFIYYLISPIRGIIVLFLRGILILSIVGIILGILGLKSSKRNFAITGIVLNTIGFLAPLIYILLIH